MNKVIKNNYSISIIRLISTEGFWGFGAKRWGLWQTKNKLTDAEPSGPYVAVFDSRMNGVRFCSIIPGAGVTEVSYDNTAWGIASGKVNGKTKVLFVGSATQGIEGTETPTRNALQKTFGGGWCDGYALLLDLPKAPAEARAQRPCLSRWVLNQLPPVSTKGRRKGRQERPTLSGREHGLPFQTGLSSVGHRRCRVSRSPGQDVAKLSLWQAC